MDAPDAVLAAAFQNYRDGRFDGAEALCRQVLDFEPENPEALHLLGLLAHQAGRDHEALDFLRRAVRSRPGAAVYRCNLAGVLSKTGHPGDAAAELAEAVRLFPDQPEAHNNLGVALESLGRFHEAAAAVHEATRLRPGYADAHFNMGNVLGKLGRPDEAVAAYEQAIRLEPAYAKAYHNLAVALQEQGRAGDAVACYRRMVELCPSSAAAHSDLLYALCHQADVPAETLFDEHVAWADRHAPPRAAPRRPRPADSARRLRVGYVSADFREHPIARFVAPVLARHDRRRVAVYCYSDVPRPDALTARFQKTAEEWRDIVPLSHGAVAQLVENDAIDVLIDLTGHIGRNRMPVFARKPAPVQMTYVGYPGTTGLDAVDFRLTDAFTDPPGLTDRWHVESLLRLPGCAWCYDPGPDDELPPVAPLPATAAGRVTFGSLNRLGKVNPPILALWARVLAAVPDSQLLVLAIGGEDNLTARAVLERGGIPGDRLTLVNRRPRRQFLELASQVDLSLDTFPYNGMTTTCDLLWMGVPTVTLAGERSVSRVGLSLLTCVGLDRLVAQTPDDYVAAAIRLASDLPALAEMRRGLRERMRHAPLSDGARVARALETAYEAAAHAYFAVT